MELDARDIVNHIRLARAYIKEKGLEVFLELAQNEPERAVKELPKYIEKVLNMNGGIFRGVNCGGPDPYTTAPLLNTIGLIYPYLDRSPREKALNNCLYFLDGLNYFNSQNNVELIDEPWLITDIFINRQLYWPGYKVYVNRLKNILAWEQFENEFMREGRLISKGAFFLSLTISRVEHCSENIRRSFAEVFPDLVDRTKDGIACLIHHNASCHIGEKNISYEEELKKELEKYEPSWKNELSKKIHDENWIILPETLERYRNKK